MQGKEKTKVAEVKAESTQKHKKRVLPTVIISALVMSLVSVNAFATDTTMNDLVSSLDIVTTLVSKVWTLIASNPLLMFFMAMGLLYCGIGVFRSLKNAAHRY